MTAKAGADRKSNAPKSLAAAPALTLCPGTATPAFASDYTVRPGDSLVSEDWAAIHFWDVTTAADGTKSADNHMQFLHFVPDGDGVRVDLCWAK